MLCRSNFVYLYLQLSIKLLQLLELVFLRNSLFSFRFFLVLSSKQCKHYTRNVLKQCSLKFRAHHLNPLLKQHQVWLSSLRDFSVQKIHKRSHQNRNYFWGGLCYLQHPHRDYLMSASLWLLFRKQSLSYFSNHPLCEVCWNK